MIETPGRQPSELHQRQMPLRMNRDRAAKRFDRTLCERQTRRSTIIFLISPIAFAGFRPLGQVWAQFMMVWQR